MSPFNLIHPCGLILLLFIPSQLMMAGEQDIDLGTRNHAVDPASLGGKCIAGDLLQNSGQLFLLTTPPCTPGVYCIRIRLKATRTNSPYTAMLQFSCRAGGASKRFSILAFKEANVYQEFKLITPLYRDKTPIPISLSWQWAGNEQSKRPPPKIKKINFTGELKSTDGEKVLENNLKDLDFALACDRVRVERLGDILLNNLKVRKLRYLPGETLQAVGQIQNCSTESQKLLLRTQLVRGFNRITEIGDQTIQVQPLDRTTFTCSAPIGKELWGCALRCILFENKQEIARIEEPFTVHPNPWAVMIGGRGVHSTEYESRSCNPNSELKPGIRKSYTNLREFVFWAPDDFGDLTPTGKYYSGQLRYYNGAASTKKMIRAFHHDGVACSFYAKFCTPGGKAGYELLRRHPNWLYPSFYDTWQLDRWDRNGEEMHVWPQLTTRTDIDAPYQYHGEEIVRSVKQFGWDCIRYDSDTTQPGVARILRVIKGVVNPQCPNFRWGYNDDVHRMSNAPKDLWQVLTEKGSMLMDEYGNHSIKDHWTYEKYARRQRIFRDRVLPRGAHFCYTYANDAANEALYQRIFTYAARSHPAFQENHDYDRFVTRYAGYIWDIQAKTLKNAKNYLSWEVPDKTLFHPLDYIYLRPASNSRTQLIIQVINQPAATRFAVRLDNAVPPPRRNITAHLRLPSSLTLLRAWQCSPDWAPDLAAKTLALSQKGETRTFTIPELRFWSMIVIELKGKWPIPAGFH